jgi:pimeloyl-ACP methyl ester carboxylesterase
MVTPRPGRLRRSGASWFLLLVPILALLSGGCFMTRKFDVEQIHQESATRQSRDPVIFIHGFIGSKLKNRHTHESVWGRFMNAIKRGKTDDLDLPIDRMPITENQDDLVPYAIYESVAGVKFYGAILDALSRVGGYHMGDINNPKPGDTCFVYYYDWRRDNVESAIGLGRAIRQIKARLHAPDMRFDLVAHSMGGLIADYYLKYGMEDVVSDGAAHQVTYAGAPNIGRLVLLGTPLQGTMGAFRILNTGFSRTMSPEVVFTMPSIYQLLPHDGHSHFVDPQGAPVDVDLYDAATWVRNGWSVFNPRHGGGAGHALNGVNGARPAAASEEAVRASKRRFLQAALDRARAFQAALERNGLEGSPVPVHVFGSDCIPTLDRAILKPGPGGPVTLFDDEKISDRDARQIERLMLAPGDGTVTADSLLALNGSAAEETSDHRPFASTFFFCETHGLLPANRGFQDNLFYVLFYSPSRPTPVAEAATRGR